MAVDPERFRLLSHDTGELEDQYVALIDILKWHKDAFEADDTASYQELMQPSRSKSTKTNRSEDEDVANYKLADAFAALKSSQQFAIDSFKGNRVWNESCRQTHFEALVCFWASPLLSVATLGKLMHSLGPNILQLINTMFVKLPPTIMKGRSWQTRASGGALCVRIEKVKYPNPEADPKVNTLDEALKWAIDAIAASKDSESENLSDSTSLASTIPQLLGADVKEKVDVYMCGQTFYDSLGHEVDNENLLEFALLLVHAPGSKDNVALLETPFGQSVSAKCWELAFPQYVWQRLMDFLNLSFLCLFATPICHATHSDEPEWMDKRSVLVFLFFSVRGMVNILIIELYSMIMLSGKHDTKYTRSLFFVAYANIFTLISLMVEGLSTYLGFKIVRDFYKPPGATVSEYFLPKVVEFFYGFWDPCDYPVDLVKEHIVTTTMYGRPVSFAMLIFAKWCIFMMTLLNFNKLSKTGLPAWHAIRSSESMWFLIYLLMLTVGCMLAYYALPVPDIGGNAGQNWIDGWTLAFTRIFRLTLMGDFDMWALEGVDDRIKLPSSLRNSTIEIENGATIAEMHKALRVWVLILALVFPVVLLNVYVGIIGKVYEDAKNANIAITGSFRIVSSFRLLLHRRFWKYVSKKCCSFCSLDSCASKMLFSGEHIRMTDEETNGDRMGSRHVAFIRIPRELLQGDNSNKAN